MEQKQSGEQCIQYGIIGISQGKKMIYLNLLIHAQNISEII